MDGLQMKYFVLKPKGKGLHAQACRQAIREYAKIIQKENSKFASELVNWMNHEREAALIESVTDNNS